MNLLDNFLKKIGVKSYEELNQEERNTFREWEEALSGRNIREEDYKSFLESELETSVGRLTEVNLSKEDEIFRKVEVRFIKKILNLLDMPKVEKALMERQIESRI